MTMAERNEVLGYRNPPRRVSYQIRSAVHLKTLTAACLANNVQVTHFSLNDDPLDGYGVAECVAANATDLLRMRCDWAKGYVE